MANKIEKLTPEQEAMMPAWRDKWIEIGLKTGECDKERFERGIRVAYKKANIPFPEKIVYVKSPMIGAIASILANGIYHKKMNNPTASAVDSSVSSAVGSAVRSAVHSAIDSTVDSAVRSAVDSAVDSEVGSAVGSAVGSSVDSAVDSSVSSAVGSAVDSAVRSAVGSAVGSSVDSAVGSAVTNTINNISNNIYVEVFAKLKSFYQLTKENIINWHYWLGGQFWVGGWYNSNSSVSFFIEVCGLKLSKDLMERYEAYRDINESVNYVWANRNFVMVCERPKAIRRNDDGQLHSDQKMAIEYPDGWGLYALDGVVLPEDMWLKIISKEMSFSEIMKIEIADQRMVALKYNPEAIIQENAKLIHKDNRNNELYLIENSEINEITKFPKMYFLKMLCPTGRTFIEGVDPAFAEKHPNATDCQAELLGLVPSEYYSLTMES